MNDVASEAGTDAAPSDDELLVSCDGSSAGREDPSSVEAAPGEDDLEARR